ncbi:band 4.1-like protein 4A isoform X9 [Pipistrellus kuhlii]|uniref:band 4.1-like protein 4A isoform X9 n=1 Tax=Pipistrellus kuhlii TaxID=59472 RepID=UPI00174F77BD|nr:band 4.1-like protein 4A isoform X9 [Pipistrellus kuhlii]
MGCFCAVPEEFYCEVLLLDESKLTLTTQQQGIKKSTRGSVVLDHVFRHINLVEIDYFGLRYCDRSHQTAAKKPICTFYSACNLIWIIHFISIGWILQKPLLNTKNLSTVAGPPYTLYFGIKFYAEDPCKLKEEITRYQFFLQVKQDVLQGRLPCPASTAAQLGAYAVQSELGDYDPYKHTAGYVSEYRFVPDQKEELEEAIERIHKTLMGQAPSEAELNYLRTAKSLEMYGVDLHPVYGENKSEYFLGLTPVGVVVYKNKKQVGKYFWPRITKVHFKETQFELRVLGKDCNETSFFFEARSKTACKHLWKCSVEHHTFFRMPENESNSLSRKLSKFGSMSYKHRYSGRTALQMSRDLSIQLPRPDQNVARSRSKTYPKRIAQTQPAGSNSINQVTANTENGENEGTTKIIAPSPIKSFQKAKNENSPDIQRSKPLAPWEENGPQSGLYNSPHDRTKSPKFPCARRRNPSCGSDDSVQPTRRRKAHNSGEDSDLKQRRRSRSRCNTSSGSESENSNREHRKKRNRRSPDVQAKEELWKHIQKELVDPSGLSEEQLKEIPYTKVDSKTDLVPPLPVTRSSDAQGSGGSTVHQRRNGSKDSLIEEKSQTSTSNLAGKHIAKTIKTIQASRLKIET